MKIYFPIFIILLFCACKQNEKTELPPKELSVVQKIANAHGFENWEKVESGKTGNAGA